MAAKNAKDLRKAHEAFPMNVAVLAGGYGRRMEMLTRDRNKVMLEVFGRPVLEHCLESLAEQHVREITLCTGYQSEHALDFVEDGKKWGLRIHHSIETEPMGTAAAFARIAPDPDSNWLVLYADVLYQEIELDSLREVFESSDVDALHITAGLDEPVTVGWMIRGKLWKGVSFNQPLDIETHLETIGVEIHTSHVSTNAVDIDLPSQLLIAQADCLRGELRPAPYYFNHAEEGIFIGRNVVIHPTATIEGPVMIGNNVWIMKGARVGPFATIGDNCIVERESTVRYSIIESFTHVGERMAAKYSILQPFRMVDINTGIGMDSVDAHLVGLNRLHSWDRVSQYVQQMIAAVTSPVWGVLILLFGMILWILRRKKPWIAIPTVASGPARRGESSFRRFEFVAPFPFRILPTFLNVLRGEMRFWGIAAMDADEDHPVRKSPFWDVLKRGNPGLISFSSLVCGPSATREERWMRDAWFVGYRTGQSPMSASTAQAS